MNKFITIKFKKLKLLVKHDNSGIIARAVTFEVVKYNSIQCKSLKRKKLLYFAGKGFRDSKVTNNRH